MQTHFQNWSLALGVDWSMPSNAKEIRAEKKRHTKDHFVLSSVAGQNWLGFHPPVVGTVYAGALLVAMVKPNAVVYVPVNPRVEGDQTLYSDAWVCAISDGMPVVGYDKVLPLADARSLAVEWSSLFPKAELVGDLSGAHATLASVIGVIDGGLQAKTIQKKQIAVALLNKQGVSVVRVAMVAAISGLAVATWFSVQAYREMQRKQTESQLALADAVRRATMSAQEKARLEAEQKAKLIAYEQQIAAARQEHKNRIAVGALWSATSAIRHSLPVSMYGYKPQVLDCTAAQCRLTWLGVGKFTSPAGKLRLPNVERNLTPDLLATSVFPLSLSKEGLPSSSVRSGEELRFLLQSQLGMHGNFTADVPQAVVVQPPAGLSTQPRTVAEVGKWRMQLRGGAALIDTKAMLGMLAKWPVRVQGVKFQAGDSVDLEGDFVFMSDQKE